MNYFNIYPLQVLRDSVLEHVESMDAFMCCCSSCKPRYKRLVDAIYPRYEEEGLVASNMQKLTFYSISHPEKLNRIGMYLVNRLSRDLYRLRFGMVQVSVEAMDQLLKSCHGSPSLQQFIESYLKMVQKLLETNDPHLEKLATDLFVRFSTIEEDTPSYHRQYDFFISKFSSMCHASRGDQTRIQRFNGLRGLRGVVWKAVSDDLQVSIWDKQHMDKIVPSILFNLKDNRESSQFNDDPTGDESVGIVLPVVTTYVEEDALNDDPNALALQCLRELMGKASFASLKAVLEPVMKHCDAHKKWYPPPVFAINTFRAIIYSIQTQNSYYVIQELMNHLDNMVNAEASIRIGIATVLSSIVSIAGTSIGPLVLNIFNSLLKRLRVSVEFQQSKQCPSIAEEKTFQETLINVMGDFANALPDYQKIEIMAFTAQNIPKLTDEERHVRTSEEFLQTVLARTLLKVATKYKTFYFAAMFTDSFFLKLLQISLAPNPGVRLDAQRIFHTLVDRHDNLKQLAHLRDVHEIENLQLSPEKCSRQDEIFMQRQIHAITAVLFRVVCLADDTNLMEHLDAVLCSMCLISVEVKYDSTRIELFRVAFGLQTLALDTESVTFSLKKRAEIHNLVAKFFIISAQLLAIPALEQRIMQVVKLRAQRGHPRLNLLTNNPINDPLKVNGSPNRAPMASMDSEDDVTARPLGLEADPALLFDLTDISEALKSSSGRDVSRLLIPFKPIAITGISTAAIDKSVGIEPSTERTFSSVQAPSSLPAAPSGNSTNVIFSTDEPDERHHRRSGKDGAGDEEDLLSLDSSSIEWTPPDSSLNSRRNTLLTPKSGDILTVNEALPTSVEALRQDLAVAFDQEEEERKDHAKSREIVDLFRDRPVEELESVLGREVGGEDRATKIFNLCKRNNEWAKIQEFGAVGKEKNIFEIDFPSIVR
uniref:tRNA exportin n=1 Tax=Panagrellus redivivus TaxID=6233 RepID=A0A7E4VCM6_PANRE